MLFITSYYTDEQVYQKSTRYSVNEYTCLQKVFRHSRFLFREPCCLWTSVCVCFVLKYFCCLLAFFGTLYIILCTENKAFHGPLSDNIPVLSRCFSLPPLLLIFFCIFFLTSSVQYNEKMKSKASLGRALHCSAGPHWSGPVITHHALSSPFGNSLLCFNLWKAKVGGLWTCQSSTWKWVKDRGNQSKSWEEEHEAWRQGDQCQARVDKRVWAVMHCTRSSTTRAPPPSAPLLIWGRSDWLTVNEGLNQTVYITADSRLWSCSTCWFLWRSFADRCPQWERPWRSKCLPRPSPVSERPVETDPL